MIYLPPSVLSFLRKALAWFPFVWKRLAARNVLQRVWCFILRSLQFCVDPPYRPDVPDGENQRTNAGRGITTKLTVITPADNPSSQLQTSIHTLWDPLSRADNKGDSSTRPRGPVSQPYRLEPLQLFSHPPKAGQVQLIRPVRLDLLAFAKPVIPGQLQRYNMSKMTETHYTEDFIQPCKLQYKERQVGWSRIIHPEGAPYYSARFGDMFVYTDTELRVPEYLGYVRDFVDVLLNASGHLPHGVRALVLELKFADGPGRREPLCFYYFVDHEKRLIFWVHQVTTKDVCGNIRSIQSEGHLRYAIHTHYWHHCERYPSNFPYAQQLYTHLQRILIVANADSMLSDTPLGPFESTDLQRLLNLMPMDKWTTTLIPTLQ
ncbi:hypothetical protein PAXRUDRAFT_352250 [Paxillus rubicundulus Ve08.2h10]|uniref:Uncharacterized protein n=1 Tax=Paxillus rubicundulus Ve08.2h10 TaxID=930991 RepID=A0A0D0DRR8_9AGAM|nr:hypothetical protein PAXRUDRAFT_352250 [Paxillus rubicundulus Ve08.2h10]